MSRRCVSDSDSSSTFQPLFPETTHLTTFVANGSGFATRRRRVNRHLGRNFRVFLFRWHCWTHGRTTTSASEYWNRKPRQNLSQIPFMFTINTEWHFHQLSSRVSHLISHTSSTAEWSASLLPAASKRRHEMDHHVMAEEKKIDFISSPVVRLA